MQTNLFIGKIAMDWCNRLSVETVRDLIIIKFNFKSFTYSEFYKYLLKLENLRLLCKIVDSSKYLTTKISSKVKLPKFFIVKSKWDLGKNNTARNFFLIYNFCSVYWNCKLDNSNVFNKYASVVKKVNL